jgi:signal peptidase I
MESKKRKVFVMPPEHRKTIQEEDQSSFGSFVLEIIKIVVICLAIIIPIRFYLIQPFFVKGESMEPNFSDKEYLIIDQISYRFTDIERGDVVVFRYPIDPSQFYIKRIVGLPGETVEIKNGEITVFNQGDTEGTLLDEKYIPPTIETPGEVNYKLGEEEYFVLGDNRNASSDSRAWGALPASNIVGKAWVRVFPVSKAQAFSAPQYSTINNN